jgi:ATP-dependent helicase/nuclease subunit B
MNLSASKADVFYGCRRLFKYRYIKSPFPEPGKKAFIIGNIAHTALELFHHKINRPKEDWPGIMGNCFKRAADRHMAEEKVVIITKADLRSIREMMQDYLDEFRENPLPETISLEKFFSIKIGEVTVKGKADRVDRTKAGSIKVIDYKTSKRPLRVEEVFESVQLPTYAYWIRSEYGEDVTVYGEYVYLRHLGTKSGHQKFRISEDLMEETAEKYKKIISELDNGCKFPRNEDFKYCGSNCDFYDFCMKDED